MKIFFIFSALIILGSCTHLSPTNRMVSQDASGPVLYSWSQLIGNNEISFRAIVTSVECPSISIEGEPKPMSVRAPVDETLALQICEFRAPQTTASASLEGVNLPVASSDLSRVVAFGDTGCRMKKAGIITVIQDCKNPDKWAFEKVSQSAAAFKPQLAIHLGDYNYRDIDCPSHNSKCEGLATKNVWKSWEQDVISPMNALLKTTPMLFVRGNHENCGGFGTGWFKFFDAGKYEVKDKCVNATPSFDVKIGNIDFVNIDSASEDNQRAETLALQKNPDDYLWLLTHRPFLAESADVNLKSAPKFSEVMQKPGAVQLVMAGHTHIGSFVAFKDNKPPELVLGNGGVMMEFFTTGPKETSNTQVSSLKENGYAAFKKIDKDNWQLLMMDKDSHVKINCSLKQNLEQKTLMNCN